MTKKIVFLTISIFFVFLLTGCNFQNDTFGSQNQSASKISSDNIAPADKIEIVHFHGTHQCWSCITVGKLALQTIKDRFAEEYQDGKIIFKEINIDLPENSEMVQKYQASGSNLFVNSIIDGKDNIKEDTNVWRLVSSEKQFGEYFQGKLNSLLGQ